MGKNNIASKSNWFERNISATHLFAAGLLSFPTFIFQKILYIKVLQTFLFILLCLLSGKGFKPLVSLVMLCSVTFMNLLTPTGKVILTIGSFPVTESALNKGLFKSFTIIGLFYISRFFIRRDLVLPGQFGRLLGRAFLYFNLFLREGFIKLRNPVESLDRTLMRTFHHKPEEKTNSAINTSVTGFVLLITLLLSSWTTVILSRTGFFPK